MESIKQAQVIKIIGRAGGRGNVSQVLIEFSKESGEKATLVRNVIGKINIGDILLLKDITKEDKIYSKFSKKRK